MVVPTATVIVVAEMGRFAGGHVSVLRGVLGIIQWRQPTQLKLALMGITPSMDPGGSPQKRRRDNNLRELLDLDQRSCRTG